MPRVVKILLVAVVLVLLVCGANVAAFQFQRAALDAGSKRFVDHTMSVMIAQWNPEELLSRSTPEMRARITVVDLRPLASQFARLGLLYQYLGADGKASMPYMFIFGQPVSASYVVKATYADGLATFEIGLVRRGGQWMIDRFHIDFLYFAQMGLGS